MVDHHIVLDNGSVDHSSTVLRKLHDEGFPLSVYRNESATFLEQYLNTALLQIARAGHDADWVLYLDCDEFLDMRKSRRTLKHTLSALQPDIQCLRFNMINYESTYRDDRDDRVVPRRIRYRAPEPSGYFKVCIRADQARNTIVDHGNHEAFAFGTSMTSVDANKIFLAHFNKRSPWQEIAKSVIGRLKVLAAGGPTLARNTAVHYTPIFEMLRHDPARLLFDAEFMNESAVDRGELIEDPIRYAGAELRYTNPTDYRLKAAQSIVAYAEFLARRYAALSEKVNDADLARRELELARII